MSSDKQTFANLSQLVYIPDNKIRSRSLRMMKEFDGWELDHQLSNDTTMVIHHPSSKTVYIAHSGTRLQGDVKQASNDVYNDTLIVLGQQSTMPRVRDGIKLSRLVEQKYHPLHIKHTGHSLGGTVATEVGRALRQESHAFNPGVGLHEFNRGRQNIWKAWMGSQDTARHMIYRTDTDVVSGATGVLKHLPSDLTVVSEKPTATDGHSIQNFSNIQTS